MVKDIIGVCVFTDLGDGCLVAKFANNHSTPMSEACKLLNKELDVSGSPFCGVYSTTWIERPGVYANAELTIVQHQTLPGVYNLKWLNPNSFEGIGMLHEGRLVCSYWNV